MALKLNIQNYEIPALLGSVVGLSDVSEIYIRVDRFNGELGNCRFWLGFYKKTFNTIDESTAEILTQLEFPQTAYYFEMTEDGSAGDTNLRQQAYNYLKTLSQFTDCQDC